MELFMSAVSESSKVMLRSPGAFAAALPALVGFHPLQSLVAVFLADGLVIVSMRLDLPETLGAVAEYVASTGTRVEADEVVLAVYCPQGEDLPHRDGVTALIAACEGAGIGVRDAMLIDGGRLWSYLCRSVECCPPEGVPIPAESGLLEAERVGLGLPMVAETRDEVVERYAPRLDLAPSPRSLRRRCRPRGGPCWMRSWSSGRATWIWYRPEPCSLQVTASRGSCARYRGLK